MAKVPRVKLGSQGLEVSALGLGCMGMSQAYGTSKTQEEVTKLIHHAVEQGATFFDTADIYEPPNIGLGSTKILEIKQKKEGPVETTGCLGMHCSLNSGSAMAKVPVVKLGSQGLEVSAQGLGCMGMSQAYGTSKTQEEVTKLIHHAVEQGVTFFDTADIYGPHVNEILVGKALKGIRDKVQIATKFAHYWEGQILKVQGDPEYVRSCCEGSLKRLEVDCIDLYYQHRVDDKVPIEITIGAMKELVEAGKVKYLGLSEASAEDIRRAHAVHPISAVQYEYSLWTRDIEEDIIPTCRELGIGIVPYSPLGRGFLAGFKAGTTSDGSGEYDFRAMLPRFQGENLAKNEELLARVEAIAKAKKCTLNQLALAWVHHKGADMAPIPGTTKIVNLNSNIGALGVSLSKEDLEELEAAVPVHEIAGDRYNEALMERTFRFISSPPLESWKPTSE